MKTTHHFKLEFNKEIEYLKKIQTEIKLKVKNLESQKAHRKASPTSRIKWKWEYEVLNKR